MFALVALPLAVDPLTYSVPQDMQALAQIGRAVTVPLRNKLEHGVILEISTSQPNFKTRPLHEILGADLSLSIPLIKLIRWLAEYYHYPVGQVLQQALPPRDALSRRVEYRATQPAATLPEEIRDSFAKRGGKRLQLLELIAEHGFIDKIPAEYKSTAQALMREGFIEKKFLIEPPKLLPISTNFAKAIPESLHAEQANAVEIILSSCAQKNPKPILLEGITGSGKTEVYLAAAKHIQREGGGVLFLVPEIALTPQLFSRVRAQLGHKVALLHSGLSDKERNDQWRLLASGEVNIALGARSAIFAPIKNLRLVIVDEEHEGAFKQEDRLRYNARDIAIVRAKMEQATIVLGSATPSLESIYNFRQGKFQRVQLDRRHGDRALPSIQIIDLRKEDMGQRLLSRKLTRALAESLEKGEQSLLFLNRRGSAGYKLCEDCGHVFRCKNCSVSLTAYSSSSKLVCHYCGYSEKSPTHCTACNSPRLRSGSPGTEALELEVKENFPQARIQRIDRQVIKNKKDLEAALNSVNNKSVDILIGTQMIAKGHDFPGLALVGVIDADLGLHMPDFRAAERTLQLLTQVSGRAGRGDYTGRVLIQTRSADNPSILAAAKQNSQDFLDAELELRHTFQYPPFFRLARILITDPSDTVAESFARSILHDLEQHAAKTIQILGPAPAVMQKIQGQFRWNILLKAKAAEQLQATLKSFAPRWRDQLPRSAMLQIDVDPVSLL